MGGICSIGNLWDTTVPKIATSRSNTNGFKSIDIEIYTVPEYIYQGYHSLYISFTVNACESAEPFL
jgi:hypothetical protein